MDDLNQKKRWRKIIGTVHMQEAPLADIFRRYHLFNHWLRTGLTGNGYIPHNVKWDVPVNFRMKE